MLPAYFVRNIFILFSRLIRRTRAIPCSSGVLSLTQCCIMPKGFQIGHEPYGAAVSRGRRKEGPHVKRGRRKRRPPLPLFTAADAEDPAARRRPNVAARVPRAPPAGLLHLLAAAAQGFPGGGAAGSGPSSAAASAAALPDWEPTQLLPDFIADDGSSVAYLPDAVFSSEAYGPAMQRVEAVVRRIEADKQALTDKQFKSKWPHVKTITGKRRELILTDLSQRQR